MFFLNIYFQCSATFPDTLKCNGRGKISQNETTWPMFKLHRPKTTSPTKNITSHVLLLHLHHHQTSTEGLKSRALAFQKYFPKTEKYRIHTTKVIVLVT